VRRNRKALESRSLADDERITFLETQLKEAKYISEDADRKYDEVTNHQTAAWAALALYRFVMARASGLYKNRVVRCCRGYLSGARCRLAYDPADATATHCLLLQ